MLTQRLMVIIFLVPIVAAFIYWGGWPFAIFIAIIMAIAAWEYWRIFQQGGYNNSQMDVGPWHSLSRITTSDSIPP